MIKMLRCVNCKELYKPESETCYCEPGSCLKDDVEVYCDKPISRTASFLVQSAGLGKLGFLAKYRWFRRASGVKKWSHWFYEPIGRKIWVKNWDRPEGPFRGRPLLELHLDKLRKKSTK